MVGWFIGGVAGNTIRRAGGNMIEAGGNDPSSHRVALRALPFEVIGGFIFCVARLTIGRAGVVEDAICPRRGVMALRTLPGVVIGGLIAGMTGLAISRRAAHMVEDAICPRGSIMTG